MERHGTQTLEKSTDFFVRESVLVRWGAEDLVGGFRRKEGWMDAR